MSSPASTSRIFTPVAVGKMKVSRMAMAPLTRFRADETTQVPKDIVVECTLLVLSLVCVSALRSVDGRG